MKASSEILPSIGSNTSDYFPDDGYFGFHMLYLLNLLLGMPIYSYVIWLIVTGTGNGLAAEFFTLNLCVCDIVLGVESVFLFLSTKFSIFWNIVSFLDGFAMTGRPLFECLMCAERYLAVVHPVTFLKYKPLRYRAIVSVFAWVATCLSGVTLVISVNFMVLLYFFSLFGQFLLYLFFQLFCLVAVLRALKQSGPSDKQKGEENHLKKRAFNNILISNTSTFLFYGPYIILMYFALSEHNKTFILVCAVLFVVAGLMQPLFFLYRVKKIIFIKSS